MFLVCIFLKLKVRIEKECSMITKCILELEVCHKINFIHYDRIYLILSDGTLKKRENLSILFAFSTS